MTRLKRLQEALVAFFHERDLSVHDVARETRLRRFAHFWLLVGKSFVRNRCPVRASALAYTTLLALIPMLAVALSVTTSLLQSKGERPFRELVDRLVSNVAPALNLKVDSGTAAATRRDEVVARITEEVGNIQSGTLGVTSMVALVFVAIGLLRTIEAAFNDIWGVSCGRGWLASFVQYWAVITVGPVVLVLAVTLTTGSHFKTISALLEKVRFIGPAVMVGLPFVVLSLAFSVFYQFMPNTRVRWQAALVGGTIGGCLWQLNNIFNVIYVSNVITYSKIYGSLGILPLFLVGLYFSWFIVLFGAQVAYAYQNRRAYLQERQTEMVSQRSREFVALRVMTRVGEIFVAGGALPTVTELASALGAPSQLVGQVVRGLVQAGLLVESVNHEPRLSPGRPLGLMTAYEVMMAVRGGGNELETVGEPSRERVRAEFERIRDAERRAALAVSLETLVQEAALATRAGAVEPIGN